MGRPKITTTTIERVYEDGEEEEEVNNGDHLVEVEKEQFKTPVTRKSTNGRKSMGSSKSGRKTSLSSRVTRAESAPRVRKGSLESPSDAEDITTPKSGKMMRVPEPKAASERVERGSRGGRHPLKSVSNVKRRRSLFSIKDCLKPSSPGLNPWDKAQKQKGFNEWIQKQQEMERQIESTRLNVVKESTLHHL